MFRESQFQFWRLGAQKPAGGGAQSSRWSFGPASGEHERPASRPAIFETARALRSSMSELWASPRVAAVVTCLNPCFIPGALAALTAFHEEVYPGADGPYHVRVSEWEQTGFSIATVVFPRAGVRRLAEICEASGFALVRGRWVALDPATRARRPFDVAAAAGDLGAPGPGDLYTFAVREGAPLSLLARDALLLHLGRGGAPPEPEPEPERGCRNGYERRCARGRAHSHPHPCWLRCEDFGGAPGALPEPRCPRACDGCGDGCELLDGHARRLGRELRAHMCERCMCEYSCQPGHEQPVEASNAPSGSRLEPGCGHCENGCSHGCSHPCRPSHPHACGHCCDNCSEHLFCRDPGAGPALDEPTGFASEAPRDGPGARPGLTRERESERGSERGSDACESEHEPGRPREPSGELGPGGSRELRDMAAFVPERLLAGPPDVPPRPLCGRLCYACEGLCELYRGHKVGAHVCLSCGDCFLTEPAEGGPELRPKHSCPHRCSNSSGNRGGRCENQCSLRAEHGLEKHICGAHRGHNE